MSNQTYFEGQSMALRLQKRFLASFNWLFVCCLFVVLFVTLLKIDYRQFFIPFHRSIVNRIPMGYLSWFPLVLITLKVTVFKNKQTFYFYCFCSLLSDCYQALLWTGPLSFLVSYKIFWLNFVLFDAILTSLIDLCFKTDMNCLM